MPARYNAADIDGAVWINATRDKEPELAASGRCSGHRDSYLSACPPCTWRSRLSCLCTLRDARGIVMDSGDGVSHTDVNLLKARVVQTNAALGQTGGRGGPEGGGPKRWGPKISRFPFPLPPQISFYLPLWLKNALPGCPSRQLPDAHVFQMQKNTQH